MFGGIDPSLLIASLMVAAVPIILAAIGELVVEKAGVLNLGVEGMMIMGAICGFMAAVGSGSPLIGFVGGALGGAALSLIFAVLTQMLLANQVATGLALTLFGLGLSSLIGQGYVGIKPPPTPDVPFGPLADLPGVGVVLFGHDPLVYLSIAAIAAVWAVLKYTRTGLVLRAVGENHDAAHALGYKVVRIRVLAIMFGGAMAGLGGAYISLVRVPQWTDGITAGAGWIALAIVVFASWKPWRILLGAYLFGGISVLQLNLQAAGALFPLVLVSVLAILWILADALLQAGTGWKHMQRNLWLWGGLAVFAAIWAVKFTGQSVPLRVEYLSMSPYLITILVLVIMSADRKRGAQAAPAALGRNFHASR